MFFKVHSCYVLWSLQFIKWLCLLITLIGLIRPNHFDWFNISQPKRVCQQARRQRHQPNNDIRCPLKSFHISGWNIFTHLCKFTHHPLPHVIRFHRPRTRKWHAVVEECEPKCRETKCSQTSRLRDISQPVCVCVCVPNSTIKRSLWSSRGVYQGDPFPRFPVIKFSFSRLCTAMSCPKLWRFSNAGWCSITFVLVSSSTSAKLYGDDNVL